MNSLRDEIEQMLNPFLMRYQAEVLSKLITEKIEKRIDSTLNLRKEEPDKKISDFFNGYLEALKDVKEMLK